MSPIIQSSEEMMHSSADSTSITAKVTHGISWLLVGNLVGRILGALRIVVLARFLSPEDFGLLGLVLLTLELINIFSETGFSDTLIQRKIIDRAYLDTAWTVELGRVVVLATLIYFIAPVVGLFFQEPRLISLLRVFVLTILLKGFNNIGITYFAKELDFRKQFILNFCSTATILLVGIVLTFVLRSVWALVWAEIARAVVFCIATYMLHSYRPRLRLNWEEARELYKFGRWLVAIGSMQMLSRNGDDALVGKLLGTATLGIYQVAYRLANLACNEIAITIAKVTFPAYSKLQDQPYRLKAAYLRTLKLSMMLITPLNFGIAAVAPALVPLLLRPQWQDAVSIVQLLSIYGWLQAFNIIVGSAFLGLGYPKYTTYSLVVNLTVMGILIWPLSISWGLIGTCLAVIAGILVAQLLNLWQLTQLTTITLMDIAKCLAVPLALSGLMWVVIAGIFALGINWGTLIGAVLLGGSLYTAGLLLTDHRFLLGEFRLILRSFLPQFS